MNKYFNISTTQLHAVFIEQKDDIGLDAQCPPPALRECLPPYVSVRVTVCYERSKKVLQNGYHAMMWILKDYLVCYQMT